MYTLILFVLVSTAAAHKWEWLRCPSNVDSMENFDMEKFQGRWYVMKKMKTSISCLTDHFSVLPETGKFNYTERQQIFDQVILNEAEIKTKDGQLKIKYPLLIPDSTFKVIDTDYDTYAIIYKCQSLPLSKRWSMSIMSRSLEMTRDTVDKLEDQFEEATSISTEGMNYVDHSNCVRDEDALFTIGMGPELSIRPGGQILKSIADGFKGLGGNDEDDIEFF